jgi:5-formyltetrahydrofolate cyclo-ligase
VKSIASKSALRRIFRERRDAFVADLSPQILNIAFSQTPNMLKKLLSTKTFVAAYAPLGSEANPMALLHTAHENGCHTALPHVSSKVAPMQFLAWQPGDPLETGLFGLQQPAAGSPTIAPDIIFVPLIAFDRRCSRLGQGGGHYDRALSVLPDAIKVGVAWSVQEIDIVPNDPWDIPLDHVLTEKEWISP